MDEIKFKRVIEGQVITFSMSRSEYVIYMEKALKEFREKNKSDLVEKTMRIDRRYEEFKTELQKLLDESH